MTLLERYLSWYHSSEFEELRIADNVQRMAAHAMRYQRGAFDGIAIVCGTCRMSSDITTWNRSGGCIWCGIKSRKLHLI